MRVEARRRVDAAGIGGIGDGVECALEDEVAAATGGAPPRLREAIRYAVFPGGARLRPRLACAVALASGADDPSVAHAEAAAIEFVHCASLVHDDLPCFDDASARRGKPTVHRRYGDATAVLVGDALIVMAFSTLARGGAPGSIALLADAVGPSRGILAGQAWEGEPDPPLEEYHRSKTAALFEAAACMGALAAGADPSPWRAFGESIGLAYQAADDLADALGGGIAAGKDAGRDAHRERPSVVRARGVEPARERVRSLLRAARGCAPSAGGAIVGWVEGFAARVGLPDLG